jgi:hypothetical protein
MHFTLRDGWYCQFLGADLKTPLPKKLRFHDVVKASELIERGGGFKNLESRSAFTHAVEIGRGGDYLELTEEEQYAALKKR